MQQRHRILRYRFVDFPLGKAFTLTVIVDFWIPSVSLPSFSVMVMT